MSIHENISKQDLPREPFQSPSCACWAQSQFLIQFGQYLSVIDPEELWASHCGGQILHLSLFLGTHMPEMNGIKHFSNEIWNPLNPA